MAALLLIASGDLRAWTPGTGSPTAVQGFVVNSTDRTDVLSFYNTAYSASQNFAAEMAWTGNVSLGLAGTTSFTFKEDVRRRVNFYRALAGLGANITFNDSDSSNDQLDALMNSANNMLNHFPPTTWIDYTSGGALAASNSDLALGNYGPDAIDAYLADTGSNNAETGHRRWILYTMGNIMGTGDIPPGTSTNSANSLWVIGNFNTSGPAQFVMWPNSGYCPLPLIPARWSLSYPDADFTHATVTMSQGATTIPCTIDYADSDASNNGSFIGDNTIVWEPAGLPPASISGDTSYTVTVSGIANVTGVTSKTYTVTVFDPNVLGQAVTISGPNSPSTAGATYTFNPIEEADAYDLQVSTGNTAAWNEGAEASPAPQIVADTTGSYPLIQSAVVHTGTKAFQLTFPNDANQTYDFSNQSFEITRQVIPTASSQLQFYTLCHFVTSTSTLSALVSTDNGSTWTQVWTTPGTSYSTTWTQNNVSLAAYAGQVILVEFVLAGNSNSVYLGTSSDYGYFLDDITIGNSTQLTNITDTPLASSATTFTLNSITAGAALQGTSTYYLRIRPEVGLKYYGFGASEIVTAENNSNITGYSTWVSLLYPTVTGGLTGDDSHDGIPNGLKYAFGLNPLVNNPATAIPVPVKSGSTLTLSFTPPGGVAGVTYGAQSSIDLVHWTALPDTGTGGKHVFSVSANGGSIFIRQYVTIAP